MGAAALTRRVEAMYSRFPYPSQDVGERRLTELANLLRLFEVEADVDFCGKSVLDVGTGTGHRLITAARRFPDTRFTAIDLCAEPLEIARATAAAAGVTNVEFHQHDIMSGAIGRGRFDVVLCMGVLHHLADARLGVARIAEAVAGDGVLFAYVYGSLGSAERMRRKEMLKLLLGPDRRNFDAGIRMVRALQLGGKNYGWNRNADDAGSSDALLVDSYLNVHENLFDIAGMIQLLHGSTLGSLMPFGITSESTGLLFDTDLDAAPRIKIPWTDMRRHLPSDEAIAAYGRLALEDRVRMVELAFQPNGYTMLAWPGGPERFSADSRIRRNALAT